MEKSLECLNEPNAAGRLNGEQRVCVNPSHTICIQTRIKYFKPAKNLMPSFTCCVRSCLGSAILSKYPGSSQLDEEFNQNAINRGWTPMLQSAAKLLVSSRSSKIFLSNTNPLVTAMCRMRVGNDREFEFIWSAPSGLAPLKAEAVPQNLRWWCLGLLGYPNINQIIGQQISDLFTKCWPTEGSNMNSNSVLQIWGIMLGALYRSLISTGFGIVSGRWYWRNICTRHPKYCLLFKRWSGIS